MSAGADPPAADISIVAVSWNTRGCLPAALDSVAAGCGARPFEIIVVDNGSHDGSVELLRERVDTQLIALETNTGFTHAANVGAAAARGRFVVFLNPDVVVAAGALDALAAALDTDPSAWAATPWFLNPDGTPQHFWRRLPGGFVTAFCFTRWGKAVDRLIGRPMQRYRNSEDLAQPDGAVPILGVGAACLMVRRDEFEAAGRFDERYLNYFQDGEIERAKHHEGRVLLGVGSAVVTHTAGVTIKTLARVEAEGQFLYALRQYLAGAAWWHRVIGEAALRLDLLLPRRERAALRAKALAPIRRR